MINETKIFSINLTDLDDFKNVGNESAIIQIFNEMQTKIESGYTIFIERRFSNAEPLLIKVIKNINDLAKYKSEWVEPIKKNN